MIIQKIKKIKGTSGIGVELETNVYPEGLLIIGCITCLIYCELSAL